MCLNIRIQQPPDHALILHVVLRCLTLEEVHAALAQRNRTDGDEASDWLRALIASIAGADRSGRGAPRLEFANGPRGGPRCATRR